MIDRGIIGAAVAALFIAAPAGAAEIDVELRQQLAAASPATQLTAIASVTRKDDRRTAWRLHRRGLGVIRFENLPFLAVRGTVDELRVAGRTAGVRRLSANSKIEHALAQSRDAVRATGVHQDLGVTGKGVGVAVLDSGADEEHPDLKDALTENVSVARERDLWEGAWALGVRRPEEIPDAGTIFLPSERDASSGHGTHVSGIVGGRGIASDGRNRGIAPGADLISVGHGDGSAVLFVLAGMDYILEHRERLNIQIVNSSFQTTNDRTLFPYDPELPVNVGSKALHDAGIAVVFAAGNWGPEPGTLNAYAPWPWVLGVANGCVPTKPEPYFACTARPHDPLTGFALADGSSRGIEGDPLIRPDVTAPGSDIVSTRPVISTQTTFKEDLEGVCGQADPLADLRWYSCMSGTSMAAPHVAGTMALLEEAAGCDLTPAQLYALVTETATPMAGYEAWEVGSGFLDARAAVDRVRAERDELCGKRKADKEKPPKAKTPREAGTAIQLEPRPVVRRRSIRVSLRPSAPVWSVRVVARRDGRVVASRHLAQVKEKATVVLRGRRTLRGKYRVVVEARDAVGRRVRATAGARAR